MANDKKHAIEKVRALFARAGRLDTPEEEARTSALLGVRLFVKYELGLSEDAETSFDREEDVHGVGGERESYDWHAHWAGVRAARTDGQPRYDRHGPIPTPRTDPPPSAKKKTSASSTQKPSAKRATPRSPRAAAAQETVRSWQNRGWKTGDESSSSPSFLIIESQYTGRCKSCGAGYMIGDKLAWRRGDGATHYDCRGFWDEGAAGIEDPFP